MEKLLSVAVPAYNAEKTLGKCLSSFLEESSLPRLEILVINDGSTDGTGKIADCYAKKYPKSFRVIHKENGGHGSGINRAVEKASGKYFRVVDADDWVLTENLSRHLQELEATNADVVVTGFHRVWQHSGKSVPTIAPQCHWGKTYPVAQLSAFLLAIKNSFSIQGITYRTEFYKAQGLRLSEKVFYEDSEYIILPFCQVKNIYFSSLFFYEYLVGQAGQSISDQNQVKRLSQFQVVFQRVCGVLKQQEALQKEQGFYFLEKLRGMCTFYLAACLLRNPDRGQGRKMAAEFLDWVAAYYPSLNSIAQNEYKKLLRLHHLHISGRAFDVALDSSVYRGIRDFLRKGRSQACSLL